jgi:hypothetical protein
MSDGDLNKAETNALLEYDSFLWNHPYVSPIPCASVKAIAQKTHSSKISGNMKPTGHRK